MGDRLVEYFSAVGLDPAAPPVAATPVDATERAIVDVTVVNQSKKDPVPAEYEVIRKTVGGHDAALNGGTIFGDRCYLAVKRGPAHAALGDIDVIFADKEQPKPHHEVLASAASGRMADLHGASRLKTALTMRRRGVIQTLAGLYECAAARRSAQVLLLLPQRRALTLAAAPRAAPSGAWLTLPSSSSPRARRPRRATL